VSKWLLLGLAIVSEVVATSCLKASDGFSRFWPSVVVIVGYGAAFYLLALTLKVIPVGVAYAIWSGVGIALIAIIGWLFFDQALDTAAVIGLALIVAGVAVLQLSSTSAAP
jgi:small multidrug resistance pump